MSVKQLTIFGEEVTVSKEKEKTVISASRRTDIPAFYLPWLKEGLERGNIEVANPMYPSQVSKIDLSQDSVHSIVLWSKDYSKLLVDMGILKEYNLYFQYTINNYSKFLEPLVPEYKDTLKTLDGLLKMHRPECFNIRFDPLMFGKGNIEKVDTDGHPKNRLTVFEQLCKDLKGLGMENCHITTSFISVYGHVKTKIERNKIELITLTDGEQIDYVKHMAEIADQYGLQLYSCASPIIENVNGIKKSHCIDGELLEELFGGMVKKTKDGGQRESCGCTYSRDIGDYTQPCKHGCKYCYVMGNK